MTKSIETEELIRLYADPGHGHTDQELAEHFEVGREAIFKRRKKLKDEGYEFIETERGRYRLDSQTFVSNIKVSWEEALILYLATRRLSRSTRLAKRPVQNALGKLATALYKPMTERLVKAAANVPEHPKESKRAKILTELIRGWSEQLKVHIRYRSLHGRQITKHTICPYLIEPSPWSDSVYVVATSNMMDGYVPFQLERIEKASLGIEPFTANAEFEEETLFQYAWGIWVDDKDPETVRLKFTGPAAIRRLQESVWHPRQSISEPDEHGHVIWQAPIAEWREMLPWVRGWGADVEVLGPAALREILIKEVEKLSRLYRLNQTSLHLKVEGGKPMDIFQQFLTSQGKTDPPLTIFEHSSDVYQVALYLISENSDTVNSPHLVKAGALFHDVGKIEQDLVKGKQWRHQPYSAKYLQLLLDHPKMKAILTDNDLDLREVNYDDLLLICEHHHDLSAKLLRRCPDALLVSVADAIASALESGWVGEIREMLSASPYYDQILSFLDSSDLVAGIDQEIHRIDLPGESVSDALLNDLIFRDMSKRLPEQALKPILQQNHSLWVVGDEKALHTLLKGYVVNPRTLYESAGLTDEIFEGVLATLPAPGSLSVHSQKFLMLNEKIATQIATGLINRKSIREAMEYFEISMDTVNQVFRGD